MTSLSREEVSAYYDKRVEGKLRDFTDCNPRIEAAVELVAEWAPQSPRRVLEIGCGIGATTWRMARAWPGAEVVGFDISPASIDVAKACFQRSNLSYRVGRIRPGSVEGPFDLVLMMDVYEHVDPSERAALHSALRELLGDESRMILTTPSPETQRHAREHASAALQPVDEELEVPDFLALADDIEADLLYYRKVGIWRYGDYLHVVLGRYSPLLPVSARQPAPGGMRHKVRRLLGMTAAEGRSDYLGGDVLRKSGRAGAFRVGHAERERIAARWRASPRSDL